MGTPSIPIVRLCALAAAVVGLLAAPSPAVPPARSRVISTGLQYPLCISSTPADPQHLFVCGLVGQIYTLDTATGAVHPDLFLDLRPLVASVGNGGLLCLAFDPNYATNGYFYVFYNSIPFNPNDRVLARYHATPGAAVADPNSGVIIWQYSRPPIGHDGGWIGFSPTNGYLYLTSGDGGTGFTFDDANNGQTLTSLQGKIFRIDVSGDDFPADPLRNYRIPPTNPYRTVSGAQEVWAYGVRNPWRCAFDVPSGQFLIADVGQDEREELDVEQSNDPGGRNYGWKCSEGTFCTGHDAGPGCVCGSPALTPPVFEYDHTVGHCIIGGSIYHGAAIPALQGLYIYGDCQDNLLFTLRLVNNAAQEVTNRTAEWRPPYPATAPISNISTFGEDTSGEIYIADVLGGIIYKLVPNTCPADFNGNGALSVQDIFDFLNAWFGNDPRANFNTVGGLEVQDIFDFINAWFAGC